ncbi:DUF4351 domain-containing protein [Leptolyngbya sp. FACHB-261]|uniref:DUF4351 domain-containing protein n=1 Tax=Leptolyngbya sp. FACHB-261 TaxID=2692806 RepID=UPI0018EFA93C|nr:DUF4351 domain-containing protein [Leptolyngbya sp. FACHB-261]
MSPPASRDSARRNQQGAERHLLQVLQFRFGDVSTEVAVAFQAMNLEQLEALMDATLAARSLNEFNCSLQSKTVE